MKSLAIDGGQPIRTKLFPAYNTIGEEEKAAVMKVLDCGNLSQYLGAWHKDFYGGPMVNTFEQEWKNIFNCKYAVSVNSNTSGLYTAIGACAIKPGDEVIVSPYTMSAGAIAPMIYGAIPVFADIDKDNFGLSPESIESKITTKTRAILAVHIFGNPCKIKEIVTIAKKHNIKVIEDCAQAPMAKIDETNVGNFGDIGVFSLNYHKHIHTGEGGMIVTNNDELAERCQLIRNHAEAVVDAKDSKHKDLYGFNYRMTEIESAIGIEQLKKLPQLVEQRIKNADFLGKRLSAINGIICPKISDGAKHVYYVQALKFNQEAFKVNRDRFVEALKAEIPSAVLREDTPLIGSGYVKPLYFQSIYKEKGLDYNRGLCPTAEQMHFNELITHEYIRPGMSKEDLDDVIAAFEKVATYYQK